MEELAEQYKKNRTDAGLSVPGKPVFQPVPPKPVTLPFNMLPLNPVTLQELMNRFGENTNGTDNSIAPCLEGGRQVTISFNTLIANDSLNKVLVL